MNIDHIKNWLQESIEFEESKVARSRQNPNDLGFCWGVRNLEVYNDLMTIVDTYSNGEKLHSKKKQCPACGQKFIPKNQLQECCSAKCRVRLHRNRNKLKDFNQKANEILKAKDPEAKFTVEQLISSDGKCPFIVDYQGKQYQSDSIRNLLTQLRNI